MELWVSLEVLALSHLQAYVLIIIGFFFVLQNYGSLNLSKFTNFVGDDWDIYVMTGLALLLGILLLLRRRQ